MASHKTITSSFVVSEKYKEYPEKFAQVLLEINYATKMFTIRPMGQVDLFIFKNGNSDSQALWSAVGKCIAEASRIADEELWHPAPKQA